MTNQPEQVDAPTADRWQALAEHLSKVERLMGPDTLALTAQQGLELLAYARNQWQPIATAPKNGKLVLLWDPRQGIRVGRLRGTNWTTVPGLWTIHPTHWMPLPEPPAEDA